MISLELNNELKQNLIDYIDSKPYSYITKKKYTTSIIRLFKEHKVLNPETSLKIIKKIKNPRDKAILSLINEYCFMKRIDFNIRFPKAVYKPRKFPQTLSLEEVKIMIESVPKPYDLMLRCIFSIGGGLRISEAIKLSWSHFRWIDWFKEKKDGIVLIKDTKRGKNIIVNVPESLMHDLYNYAKELDILNEFFIPTGGVLFPMGLDSYDRDLYKIDFEKWKQEYLQHAYHWFRYNILKKYCEPALGRKLHIHMLRHTRATYLLEKGIPIERIKELMGHSSIETTMIYAKMNPKKTLETVRGIGELQN